MSRGTVVGMGKLRGGAWRCQFGMLAGIVIASIIFPVAADAQETDDGIDDLAALSLEELMNVEVTSVSKKAEKRTDAAAAIFVLTNEDIRRSGARSIPDALRLVPGVAVANIDQNIWSVTSRGFAGRFANKLLVLIDGRSIYTPSFSGVFWEFQDVMLEDVDRIEVIRGPGGTLWGANAVNGVINIVTEKSADTQGGLIVSGIGDEYGLGEMRYGGRISEDDFYRVYTRYWQRDGGKDSVLGNDGFDDGQMLQGGLRMDFTVNERDTFTFQGDIFNQTKDQLQFIPSVPAEGFIADVTDTNVEGFNVLARWERAVHEDSDVQLQFYHDYYNLRNIITEQRYHITDLEFQHRYRFNERNEIIWGFGARQIQDSFEPTQFLSYNNLSDTTYIFSAFVQEEFTVTEDFVLTFGTKFEHNDYTGFEVQPSARFRWNPTDNQTVWGAASRAVRTPSRALDDIILPVNAQSAAEFEAASGLPMGTIFPPFPVLTLFNGSDSFDSEDLLSFELGYRISPNERWAIDVATYYNIYDDLSTTTVLPGTIFGPLSGPEPALGIPQPYFTIVTEANNDGDGEVYGAEITVDYAPRGWLRLTGSYSFAEIHLSDGLEGDEGNYPEQMAWGRIRVNPAEAVDLDVILRYMDQLPSVADIDNYFTIDARIAWRPINDLELSIAGRNLIEDDRLEFRSNTILFQDTEVERSVYGQVSWQF